MKIQNLLIILFFIGLLNNSCKKVDELTHFNKSFDFTETLPPFPIINEEPLAIPFPVETNSAETFDEYNTSPDLIEEVKLTEASLQILTPMGANFSFLKSVSFYLDDDDANGDFEKVLIATKENISNDIGATIDLEIVDQDLSDFIVKEDVIIWIEIATDEVVTEELELKIFTNFFIDAEILGI